MITNHLAATTSQSHCMTNTYVTQRYTERLRVGVVWIGAKRDRRYSFPTAIHVEGNISRVRRRMVRQAEVHLQEVSECTGHPALT